MLLSVPKILSCEPNPGKLPARFRGEKVAIGSADVRRGSDARSAAQNEIPAHELAVIFAERAGQGTEPWIAEIGARRPLPAVAEDLSRLAASGRLRRCYRLKEAALQQISFDAADNDKVRKTLDEFQKIASEFRVKRNCDRSRGCDAAE